MANPWFKFYGSEYLSDPKTRNFTAEQHSCWLHLLCFASNSSKPGIIEHLTEESLRIYAGCNKNSVTDEKSVTQEPEKNILEMFEKLGMIKRDGNKITVKRWKKRQETRSESYERVKKFRAKSNVTVTLRNDRIEEKRIDKKRREESISPANTTRTFFEVIEKQTEPTYTETLKDLTEKTGLSESFVKHEVQKFALYWTEPTKSGKQLRWEKQDAFEIRRRLATWFRNAENFNQK